MTTSEPRPGDRRGLAWFLLLLAAMAALFLQRALAAELFVSLETVWRSVQPWSGLLPAPPPIHNENLADPAVFWYPVQQFNRTAMSEWLAGGEPPLWCHESFAGAPWFGNLQSALLSPFTWLFWVVPFAPAFAVCAAAKWFVAGVGAWFLARRLGIGPAGRALAGIAFAFCGFQVVWIDSPLTNVSVLAPWLLLAIERLIERPGPGRAAVVALASFEVLVGGHPETAFWTAVAATVIAVARVVGMSSPMPRRGAAIAWLLVAALLGGALAIVQWWPFLEYALASYGNELRRLAPELRVAPGGVWRFAWLGAVVLLCLVGRAATASPSIRRVPVGVALVTCLLLGVLLRCGGMDSNLLLQLLPDWFGRSLDGGHYSGPLTYCDVVAGFCGSALLLAALATAVIRWRDARLAPIALAAFVTTFRWFRVPGLAELVDHSATLQTIGSSRALGILALMVALLGGAALDELAARPRRLATVMAGALLLFAGIAIGPLPLRAGPNSLTSPNLQTSPTLPPAALSSPRIELPADTSDPGPSQLGAEIHGFAPGDAASVRIVVNGRELGRVAPGPVSGSTAAPGLAPFSWRWLQSHRLEEGEYAIDAQAERSDGSWQTFASATWNARRAPQPSTRWLVHLGAVVLVIGTALLGRPRTSALLLGVTTLAELAFFGVGYQATTPPSQLPSAVDPLPFLQRERLAHGPFRVLAAKTHLHPNLHLLFGIEELRGYDALEPLAYTRLFQLLYSHGEVPWVAIDTSTLLLEGGFGEPLLDVLGVRYMLTEETPPSSLREVWRRGPLALFENGDALARAFTVQRAIATQAAYESHADPRLVATWDEPGETRFDGSGHVSALEHQRGHLSMEVESDAGTIVVIAENFGGWEAELDGHPVAIRRSHLSLMSVVVPDGGRHRLELVYRPRSVLVGALLSGAALVALLGLVVLAMRRSGASR